MVMVHARLAAVFGVLRRRAVVLGAPARRARDLRRPLTAVCVLVAIAGLIGKLQYHQLDYPAALVWSHVDRRDAVVEQPRLGAAGRGPRRRGHGAVSRAGGGATRSGGGVTNPGGRRRVAVLA